MVDRCELIDNGLLATNTSFFANREMRDRVAAEWNQAGELVCI